MEWVRVQVCVQVLGSRGRYGIELLIAYFGLCSSREVSLLEVRWALSDKRGGGGGARVCVHEGVLFLCL